jgi:hypothetical protein
MSALEDSGAIAAEVTFPHDAPFLASFRISILLLGYKAIYAQLPPRDTSLVSSPLSSRLVSTPRRAYPAGSGNA